MNELNTLLFLCSAGQLGGSIENCVVIAYDNGYLATSENAAKELAQLRERAEISKRWADIAIEMINELRMDYVPGELGDLDGIKAIRKLRADNARLQKAVDVLAETLKETLGKLDEYKGDDDGYVIEHGYVVLKEYRSGKEQK
jgi:hypothetical protein